MPFLALLLFLLTAAPAHAEITLAKRYLEDKHSSFSIEEIKSPELASSWQAVDQLKPSFGPTRSKFWVRFFVPEEVSYSSLAVMLEIPNGLLSRTELFAVTGQRVEFLGATGYAVPLYDRGAAVIRTGTPTFRLGAPRNPQTEYFLSVESDFPLALPLTAMTSTQYNDHLSLQLLLLGAFFGCFLMMAAFNGFVAISLRSSLYGNYAMFVATIGLMYFALEGFSVQLLWGNLHWIAEREFSIFGGLAVYFYTQFVRQFLNTRAITPKLDRAMMIAMGISCVSAILMQFLPRQGLGIVGHMASVAVNVFVLLIGAEALRQKQKAARFFFISSLGFNVSMIVFMLQENNIVYVGAYAARAVHVGTALEILLLSFALADHIRTIYSELNQQKMAMVHSEKLRALGRLAGEIAHEINNPLAIIHGNAALILNHEPTPAVKDFARSIELTANRISKIVKGMRSLSRDSRNDPLQLVCMAALLQDAVSLCAERAQIGKIQLQVPTVDNELLVSCRSSEICQVLINLINNAFDAVEGRPDPKVIIEIYPGNGITEISISDNGAGIPEEIRAKILEPFFTTKPIGKGLGLGLSISRSIVESHGGELRLDECAFPTRFKFTLNSEKTAAV